MGLADDLDARTLMPTVDDVLEGLPRDDQEALMRALTDKQGRFYRWSAPDLASRLAKDGFELSAWSISEWRRANVG